ncbi:LacI family transcriptional regulator [Actinobacillus succinogenes]|uniref:Alanine racemase n=1 Tax=Actinobacillus succinogenes (strain ATCC 55618 / DSM 22257 / CCUG 43843 / 130Z) TaxID=339671 RepID=A6VL88_ACTSZ|nr:LacI family DNA-binding transcriptional regulator [Actinobacillus succinogenes]ABR73735.1 Alanine racemase [Actinobacillus succinogenes 130Z]PHI39807.1 LacI family transcriptional regulator [Actinobacillus succinogenes]
MSIQDLARRAGVSVATVSRVLNNQPSVKPQNKEKVLAAIKELNYQPNLLARQLRTAKTGMLLVMVSNIANPFCAAVVKGIEKTAEKNGYRILLCNTESDLARSRSCLTLLSGKMVDGVITMDALSELPELQNIIGAFPWVQCAEYDPLSTVSSVSIDDVAASEYVVDQLVKSGKKRIALINHDLAYQYAQHRESGYLNRLKFHGLDYSRISYAENLDYMAGKLATFSLLKSAVKPDAIFAISDVLAAGAIQALTESGLSIPQDVAVVGFDGVDISQITVPALTTVQQPSEQIGMKAVSLLLEQIHSDVLAKTVHHLLPWKFVRRQSS